MIRGTMCSVGLAGLLVVVVGVGCAAPASDDATADDSQAVRASDTLAGVYGGGAQETLEIVVAPGRVDAVVQGRLRAFATSNGGVVDAASACQLTFSGVLGSGERTLQLDVADGRGASQGELRIGERSVTLVLGDPSPACENAYFRSGDLRDGLELARRGARPDGIVGYRTVQAERAHFWDAPSAGTARRAYVVRGDTVAVQSRGSERANVTFSPLGGGRETTGFVAEEDFAPLGRDVEQLLGLVTP